LTGFFVTRGLGITREKKKENDANQSNSNNKTRDFCQVSEWGGINRDADVVVFVVVLSLPF
jgi:hypothetical protein